MNRLILKYGSPITAVILAVFAWVVYRRVAAHSQIAPLVLAAAVVWVLGTVAFIYFWPRITVNGFKRAIVGGGFGGRPVPVNTLYAEPTRSSASASNASLMGTGTDDVLYVAGWLDLRNGPQVLHVPDMAGRYYSVQLTNPADGANFAYVGKRTTGTQAGDFVLSAPGADVVVPTGMGAIAAPNPAVLVIGRVFVADESDQPAAYALAQQIHVTPFMSQGAD